MLLTTALKPFSPCTTPRRLMVPISRHFLPVLQPEPVAWLTTGLMKGSRRPFALDLLSGLTDCSLPFSDSLLAALPLPANAVSGDLASTIPGFGWAWRRAGTDVIFLVVPVFFIPAEPAVAVDFVADAALTVTGAAWLSVA